MSRNLILIRHGRPCLEHPFTAIAEHLHAYDEAVIDSGLPPPKELVELAGRIDTWLCSPLPRAQSSLARLSPLAQPLVSDLFREAPLPAIEKPRFIPLPIWLAYLRGRWMQGRLTASESIQDCRSRAAQAAEFILSSIGDKREAALMGHGFFNHLLTQALADRGWQSISSGRGYWSVNHLSKT